MKLIKVAAVAALCLGSASASVLPMNSTTPRPPAKLQTTQSCSDQPKVMAQVAKDYNEHPNNHVVIHSFVVEAVEGGVWLNCHVKQDGGTDVDIVYGIAQSLLHPEPSNWSKDHDGANITYSCNTAITQQHTPLTPCRFFAKKSQVIWQQG